MMIPFILLFCFISQVIYTDHLNISAGYVFCELHFYPCNRTVLEGIITENALLIDRTPQEHYDICEQALRFYKLSNETEWDQMNEDIEKVLHVKYNFTTTREVLNAFCANNELFCQVVMRWKRHIDDLGIRASVGKEAVIFVDGIINRTFLEYPAKFLRQGVVLYPYQEVWMLAYSIRGWFPRQSETVQEELERWMCLRTVHQAIVEIAESFMETFDGKRDELIA